MTGLGSYLVSIRAKCSRIAALFQFLFLACQLSLAVTRSITRSIPCYIPCSITCLRTLWPIHQAYVPFGSVLFERMMAYTRFTVRQ
jgi:hypothetical protein